MNYNYAYRGRSLEQFPGGGLGCLLAGVLLVLGGYYLVKGVYYLLLWAAPALLVLALIINWRVFPDTFKNWFKSLQTNPMSALLTLALSVIAFPFFSLYIFLKAIGYRKMEQLRREFGTADEPQQEAEYVDFEEIESRPKGSNGREEPEWGEAPAEPEKAQPKKGENPYDGFFG